MEFSMTIVNFPAITAAVDPTTAVTRPQAAARVRAIITRRAESSGISALAYFDDIKAGRAARITLAEMFAEPPQPTP
jgi:hypothetical protein